MAERGSFAGTTEASVAAAAAARVVRRHVSDGEYQQVLAVLPESLRPVLDGATTPAEEVASR